MQITGSKVRGAELGSSEPLAHLQLSVFAKVRAVRTGGSVSLSSVRNGGSVSLSSVRNGGEGRGEEALYHDDTSRKGGAPLSPFVPHGARETDALLITKAPARTFASTDNYQTIQP
ncbi:hypothetical protein LBMAG56_40380 [Verrucomicrobiota bacterium]|nr:hypothetical protein LBMAG56_40380 [Verrucomicrobiota bacterium]